MRKKPKRLVALLLSLLMVISIIHTTGLTVEAAAKPKLAKNSTTIVIGGTSKIKVKNVAKGAKITYKSAKKNIATVSKKGMVKGIKSGTTKITVSIKKNSKTTTLTYKATVKKPKLSKSKLSLVSGKTAKLSVKNKPKKAKYTWKSSNTKVATVNKKGKVTAKRNGKSTIRVKVKTSRKTYKLSCRLTVQSPNKDSATENMLSGYTITFDSDGGTEVSPQLVRSGKFPLEPEDPQKEGFTFAGWLNPDGDYFDFTESISKDVLLTAEWLQTVDVNENDLIVLKDKNVEGKEITEIQNSTINNVEVEYTLDDIGAVSISEIVSDPMTRTAGLVGNPVEIKACGGTVKNAVIKFHYEPSQLNGIEPSDLAIVWYDEENNIVTLLEDSVVDITNHTVSVATTHFSKYGIASRKAWDEAWRTQLPAVRTDNSPYYNIVLAMDCSGSMDADKMSKSIEATQNLVDVLADDDCVSVLAFSNYTYEISRCLRLGDASQEDGYLNNRDLIKGKISTLSSGGGTNIQKVLQQAISYNDGNSQYQQLVILLSDGQSSVSDKTINDVKNSGQRVIAVGIGNDVDESLMRRIGEGTNGSYIHCQDADDLKSAFIELQNIYIGSTVDSDGDGLPDLVEISGMRDQYGEIYRTDKDNPDTDGDGYSDGEEMGTYVPNTAHPYFKRVSQPDFYTVKSDDAYLLMPDTMMHSFDCGDNKINLIVYVTACTYRRVPDLLTPPDEDGIPKEYIHSEPRNLNVELTEIPSTFKLESIKTIQEEGLAEGIASSYKTVATLSYSKSTELDSVTWRVTADNCSEWSGYSENGIKVNYISKKQPVSNPKKLEVKNDELENKKLKLAKIAKNLSSKIFTNADSSLIQSESVTKEELKEQIQEVSSTLNTSVPDEVYEVFAKAIFKAMASSNIDKYETNQNKMAQQIYTQIKGGLENYEEVVTVGKIQYRVKGTIYALSFGGHSASVAWQYVNWGTNQVILTWQNEASEAYLALANYCAALEELNNDLWKDFLAYYVSDAFGLADITTVTKDNVLNVMNAGEKVIKALCDKNSADALIAEMDKQSKGKLIEKLQSGWTNKFKAFVKENIPNGKEIVSAAEKYEKAKKKYDELESKWNEYQNSDDTEKLCKEFETLYEALENAMKGI